MNDPQQGGNRTQCHGDIYWAGRQIDEIILTAIHKHIVNFHSTSFSHQCASKQSGL